MNNSTNHPTQMWQERIYAHLSYATASAEKDGTDGIQALADALNELAHKDFNITFAQLLQRLQPSGVVSTAHSESTDSADSWDFDEDESGTRYSPMRLFGYTVAEREDLTTHDRRQILSNFFASSELPHEEQDDVEDWGAPHSGRRLARMARHITSMINLNQSPQAKSKWQEDLAWMRGRLYRPSMQFAWPVLAAPTARRTPNADFMKPLIPSAKLAAIVGKDPLPRTEVTKKVWEHIKKHKLQDPVNKRLINADGKLKLIFGKSQASMFEMTKMISAHLS